jgi:hypothetical protein
VIAIPHPELLDEEATMRALTLIMALLFALATVSVMPASAQNEGGSRPTARTDAQKQQDKEIDDAYRAATRGGPAAAPKVDPWGRVRPADADKNAKQ